jgi:hypothetical protein
MLNLFLLGVFIGELSMVIYYEKRIKQDTFFNKKEKEELKDLKDKEVNYE